MSRSRPGEGASAAPAAVRFPRVPGRSLLGRDLRLPAELPALRTLAVVAYTDVGAFRRPLAIPGTDDVHALVVTRVGEVLARASGEPTDEGWAVLAEALGCGGG